MLRWSILIKTTCWWMEWKIFPESFWSLFTKSTHTHTQNKRDKSALLFCLSSVVTSDGPINENCGQIIRLTGILYARKSDFIPIVILFTLPTLYVTLFCFTFFRPCWWKINKEKCQTTMEIERKKRIAKKKNTQVLVANVIYCIYEM